MPLSVLCGFDQAAVADVGAGLLLSTSRVALIWVDPATAPDGYVLSRVTDSDGRCTERRVSLDHGCLSCAMREAVVQAVRGLSATGRYDALAIHLHPGVEADGAIAAVDAELAGIAAVDTVVTVLQPPWLEVLAGDTDASTAGIAVTADDERSAATILAANLDAATVVIFSHGFSQGVGAAAEPEEHAALAVLAPDAVRVYPQTALDVDVKLLIRTGSFDPDMLDPFTSRGMLDRQRNLPAPNGSLRLVRWASRRPMHPQRFHAALDELADGVVRSVGYLWFANRPELVVGWDSAGDSLSLGPACHWLTPAPGENTVPPGLGQDVSYPQRAHAARNDHPYFGDRAALLAFLGDDLDRSRILATLEACLLTDAELARGPGSWRQLADPFPEWFIPEQPITAERNTTGRAATRRDATGYDGPESGPRGSEPSITRKDQGAA